MMLSTRRAMLFIHSGSQQIDRITGLTPGLFSKKKHNSVGWIFLASQLF